MNDHRLTDRRWRLLRAQQRKGAIYDVDWCELSSYAAESMSSVQLLQLLDINSRFRLLRVHPEAFHLSTYSANHNQMYEYSQFRGHYIDMHWHNLELRHNSYVIATRLWDVKNLRILEQASLTYDTMTSYLFLNSWSTHYIHWENEYL